MRRFPVLGWLVLMWAAGLSAFADGKAFARPGFARAEIPEQRALIHWADGVETLVIESVVKAEGTNVAWVVPLPAVPETVTPASTALFPTLQNIFQARVETRHDDTGWLWAAFAGLLWYLRWIARLRGAAERIAALLALAAALIMAGMLLPALATAKAGGQLVRTSTVQVLSRTRAGVYDVTTLTAKQPSDLLDWLRGNGFEAPKDLEPTIAEHLRDGWVFVAARAVRETNSREPFALHPLQFRFRTSEPVYPLRLTGAGATKAVRVDLYVFGPARAEVDGFRAAYCGRAHYQPYEGYREVPLLLQIRQPELAAILQSAAVGTKLSATLEPAAMRRDARVRWVGFRSAGETVFASSAAWSQAGTWAGLFLAVGALLGLWRQIARPRKAPAFCRVHLAWCVLAGAIWVAVYALLPRIDDAKVVRAPRGHWRNAMIELEILGTEAIEAVPTRGGALSAEEALATIRAGIAVGIADTNIAASCRNVFTGEPMREESSPGNYSVVVSNRAALLLWHDFYAAPMPHCAIDWDTIPPSSRR